MPQIYFNKTFQLAQITFNLLWTLKNYIFKSCHHPLLSLANGWDAEEAKCDATKGGLSPGAQIALIILCLGALCVGTFLWQRWKRSRAPKEGAVNQPKYAGDVPDFNRERAFGMGKDGFDNLQTVGLGELSPLPQPKCRPGGGYHPAGKGIHDFMGTCTIGTVSQNPKLGDWHEDPKNLA